MSDDSWLETRVCVDCDSAALCDPQYDGEPRCGACWAALVGASQVVGAFRVAPPKVPNIVGRKRPGRYVKGEYVYWDDINR